MLKTSFICFLMAVPILVDGLLCLITMQSVHGLHEGAAGSIVECLACKSIALRSLVSTAVHILLVMALLHAFARQIMRVSRSTDKTLAEVRRAELQLQALLATARAGLDGEAVPVPYSGDEAGSAVAGGSFASECCAQNN